MRIASISVRDNDVIEEVNLDFTVNDAVASTIVIAGENGLGKTTLLNLLMEGIYSDFAIDNFKKLGGGNITIKVRFSLEESKLLIRNFNLTEPDNLKYLDIVIHNNYGHFNYDLYIDEDFILSFDKHEFGSNHYAIRNFFQYIYIENISRFYHQIERDGGRFYKTNQGIDAEILSLTKNILTEDKASILKCVENGELNLIQNFKFKIDNVINAMNKMLSKKTMMKEFSKDELKYVNNKGKEIYLEHMSSGEKNLLLLALTLVYKNEISDNAIVFTEEPENSLHPNWQAKIIDFMKDITKAKENYNQIIITTHSHIVIDSLVNNDTKVVIFKEGIEGIEINCYESFNDDHSLSAEAFQYAVEKLITNDKPIIITEGKTDWKHIKSALKHFHGKGEFMEIDVDFVEYEFTLGDKELEKSIDRLALIPHKAPVLAVFDSDNGFGSKYAEVFNKGNNIYAMSLPLPKHREYHSGISIELLYNNNDLKKQLAGKRLYLSSEFDSLTLRLKEDTDIICRSPNLITDNSVKIENEKVIDSYVYNLNKDSLCLSKDEFANYVLNSVGPFAEMDFEGFRPLFEKIRDVLR